MNIGINGSNGMGLANVKFFKDVGTRFSRPRNDPLSSKQVFACYYLIINCHIQQQNVIIIKHSSLKQTKKTKQKNPHKHAKNPNPQQQQQQQQQQ